MKSSGMFGALRGAKHNDGNGTVVEEDELQRIVQAQHLYQAIRSSLFRHDCFSD